YWDEENTPRPEGYIQDLEIFHNAKGNTDQLYRNIRAACESGWDFSSRWFANPNDVTTIKTIDLIPVDLNCLLYNLENTIAQAYKVEGKENECEYFIQLANKRAKAIDHYLWNDEECCFYDYDFMQNTLSKVLSMATAFPLFFNLCNAEKAELVLKRIEKDLLKVGGLLTTINTTSQQWDAPNGWAPLQWIGYKAAQNYGAKDLAFTIGANWTKNVERVFNTTGKMMEKYNVIDITLAAGGGEYPNQDGFGWTNGCYLKLKELI
ncbi:MAG: trehalase, partial [Pedobacter sp.]